jgi:hypothetical protein
MKTLSSKALVVIILLVSFFPGIPSLFGQDVKPEKKVLKNSVKLNLTNPMIFGDQCYMLGYERTIGAHQSFSLNIGRFSMPKVFNINTDSIKEVSKSTQSKGFHLSGDYRFYLQNENKHNAPRGVYIGPYFTYNSFTRNYTLSATTPSFTGDLNADFSFRIASVGFQLGYQFLFWNRVSLDLILFGPGIASYKLKTNLSTTLDADTESELFQKINDALSQKIPGYDLVLKPGTFERTGSTNTTSFGYRYVVMLGFRF